MAHPPSPSTLTSADLAALKNVSNILHLFAHRNHNQHRRSPWYRHFDSFRRQLARLIAELSLCANDDSTSKTSATHAGTSIPSAVMMKAMTKEATLRAVEAASKRRQRADEASLKSQKRLVFWREQLVWRWWGAFETVIGDVQFAPLGLVLLACLGEVCEVLGIVASLGEGSVEEQMGVEQDGEGCGVSKASGEENVGLRVGFGEEGVDVGVSVKRGREEEPDLVEGEETYASTIPGSQKVEFTQEEKQEMKRRLPEASKKNISAARSRKRKRPIDAIDELFNGLA